MFRVTAQAQSGPGRSDEDRREAQPGPVSVERLIGEHLALARTLAGRYTGRGETLEDLEQVARVGLVNAARRYDATRGVPFASFAAITIVGELKHHFRDRRWSMRVPRRVQDLYLRVRDERETLTATLNRAPTVAELAAMVDAEVEDVLEALDAAAASFGMASLEDVLLGGARVIDALAIHGEFAAVDDCDWIDWALAQLSEAERQLLRLRFTEELTQRHIAALLGVSQMQVSRLLQQVLEKLRTLRLQDADH